MKKYKIEKCKELKCWIVFERLNVNMLWDVYHARLKKECINWVKERGEIIK